jgi:hypothetical protein
MPDILGQTERDYQFYKDMAAKKMLDAHNYQLKTRGLVHDFNALPSKHNPVKVPLNDIEASAQALGFVTNNFQAIQAMVEEILYTDFRLDSYFPIITTIPEGATTYSYKVANKYGLGKFIDNSGKDANRASASMQNVPYALEYAGIIPSWTLEDVRGAAFAGIPLDTHSIQAGTEGCLDHIEIVGLEGDASRSFTGLINQADIPAANSTKTIANMTADEMVKFILDGVSDIISQSAEVMSRIIKTGLTIYFPLAQETLIGDTKLATDASKTVWEYVRVNNQWTRRTGQELKMESVAEMAGAGSGATDRCLFGFNHDRIMEMAMPIQPRVIRMVETHYGVDAPMEYKISGLNVKRPTVMRYFDAI